MKIDLQDTIKQLTAAAQYRELGIFGSKNHQISSEIVSIYARTGKFPVAGHFPDRVFVIANITVEDEYQNQGVLKAILAHLENAEEIHHVLFESVVNDDLKRHLERRGYQECTVRPGNFHKPSSNLENRKQKLKEIILETVQEYQEAGIAPDRINCGQCENFAEDVLNKWAGPDWIYREGQEDWHTEETLSFSPDGDLPDIRNIEIKYGCHRGVLALSPEQREELAKDLPNHIWISFAGKCYDSDHPEGVDNPFELTGFQLALEHVTNTATAGPRP